MSGYKYCEFQVIDLPLFFLPNHLSGNGWPQYPTLFFDGWRHHAVVVWNFIFRSKAGHSCK